MWVVPLNEAPLAAHIVALDMREWDRKEIFATRRDDDVADFAADVLECGPVFWAAGRYPNVPIAVFGCLEMWPGVWSMWFFATDELPQIGKSVTRLIIKAIVPYLFQSGAHRLECRSMEGHVDAQRWLEVLGARREATLRAFGRGGEDFHVYVWDRPHVLQ